MLPTIRSRRPSCGSIATSGRSSKRNDWRHGCTRSLGTWFTITTEKDQLPGNTLRLLNDLERELFGFSVREEMVVPDYPECWSIKEDEATRRAKRLVEIGVFELRGDKKSPRSWVPFLYRPGFAVVQGKAV